MEGDTGSTTEALFTFRLSAATGRTVSVNYATSNLTRHWRRFAAVTRAQTMKQHQAQITFQPGNTSVTIPVKICGEQVRKRTRPSELIFRTLPTQIAGSFNGSATIIDDDVLELLLEESGPTVESGSSSRRISFPQRSVPRCRHSGMVPDRTDRNTRVMLFVRDLQLNPGESCRPLSSSG